MAVIRLRSDQLQLSRRRLLAAAGSAALINFASMGIGHAALVPTPRQTAGPFYPKSLPVDSDNDLARVAGHERQASGTVTHVLGRVLDSDGRSVPGAKIEIWQCDSHGRYHNVDDHASPPIDPDFQGYGRTVSAADGSYAFRTIRPVPYPGRTAHIHFAITTARGWRLVTQMYVAGEPLNERDPIFASIRDPAERTRVVVPLEPAAQLEPGALSGTFDIVLGV
jgi:protocatechuate 3,4-dioxygenase, beta subunit